MATYCTRIYVKVDSEEMMNRLCNMDVSDIGKGFYSAKDFFKTGNTTSFFYDTESAIGEEDIHTIVERVTAIIEGHGLVLADTWSYDYDPLPEVCFYNGGKIISKLIEMDGEEFCDSVNIQNVDEWISFVETDENLREGIDEDV